MFNLCRICYLVRLLRWETIGLILGLRIALVVPRRACLSVDPNCGPFQIKIRRRRNNANQTINLNIGRPWVIRRIFNDVFRRVFIRAATSHHFLTRAIRYIKKGFLCTYPLCKGLIPVPTDALRSGAIRHHAFRLLFHTTTTVIMLAFMVSEVKVEQRIGLSVFRPIFFRRIRIRSGARRIARFIQCILRRFINVNGTSCFTIIVRACVCLTTDDIDGTTCPFRVFIAPTFFPFHVLIFVRGRFFIYGVDGGAIYRREVSIVLPLLSDNVTPNHSWSRLSHPQLSTKLPSKYNRD